MESHKRYKLNSNNDFFYPDQHLKINNTNIAPERVAQMIRDELISRELYAT
jgi:hypothetical protein